jgi:uncharacterized protein YheU (UPF0270 family)
MIIPYNELSEDALHSLIEDFVTRDGTDYGKDEMTRQEKAAHLFELLKTGELLISYNEESETCGLVTREKLRKNPASE